MFRNEDFFIYIQAEAFFKLIVYFYANGPLLVFENNVLYPSSPTRIHTFTPPRDIVYAQSLYMCNFGVLSDAQIV